MPYRTITLSFILAFFLGWSLEAQEPSLECGTPPVKSDWLKEYQKSPWKFNTRSQERLTIPLTVHIVGTDQGAGYYSERTLLNDICKLNQDFDQANIQFYIKTLNYIDNSDWYNHDSYQQGKLMMSYNNVPGTVNCYIVASPAGNCGYYSGQLDAVALNKGCLGGLGSTWTHELGHFFSLPHTFLGWEGRDYDPDNKTPETVGSHNRPVELVDGSNCEEAADGFCDTGPDYLSYRWSCSSNNKSDVIQYDPEGIQFRSDGRFFMSYSSGSSCRTLFSQEQIDAMRANILDHRPNLADPQVEFEWNNTMRTDLVYPVEDTTVQYDDFTLRWKEIETAEYYVVKVGRFKSLPAAQKWVVEGDTTLDIKDEHTIYSGNKYYWRVTPYSHIHTCVENSALGAFVTDDMTASTDPSRSKDWTIFPNPTSSKLNIQVRKRYTEGTLELQSISGQLLQRWSMNGQPSRSLQLDAFPPGMYLITLKTEETIYSDKVVLE